MWPFRRRAPHCLLRLGRRAVERWQRNENGWSCTIEIGLPSVGPPDPKQLSGALNALLDSTIDHPLTVLLESAWLPVALLDTGGRIWSMSQLEMLARHRLGLAYSGLYDDVNDWELRFDHQIGERSALVFALPRSVRDALRQVALDAKGRSTVWSPAFDWGIQQSRRHGAGALKAGWWMLLEQDRTIVARLVNGRVVALDAASPVLVDDEQAPSMVEVAAARWGLPTDGPLLTARWSASSAPGHENLKCRRPSPLDARLSPSLMTAFPGSGA